MKKILITCALPYANGEIHLGHTVEYTMGDILARYHRSRGRSVAFICADDTHGAPIMLRAKEEGIPPEELIERMSIVHQKDFCDLGVDFDHYGSTHSPSNEGLCGEFWAQLKDRGHIFSRWVDQPLRRIRWNVSRRPLCDRNLPYLWLSRPVWGQLRGLRRNLLGH